jgi:hypothetical protein
MILCFIHKSDYIDDFWVGNDSVFINDLYVNNRIYTLMILYGNRRTDCVDDSWVKSDSVFVNDSWVNNECVCW